MAPPVERIRNIAVGIVVRDGHALVELYATNGRHAEFARAIGGGVEFGETALDAVHREFMEELGVTLTDAELLAVTENIFEIDGRPGHEVVHVFAVSSPQLDSLALDDVLPVLDNHTTVRWLSLDSLRAEDPPFYPSGMSELATTLGRHSTRSVRRETRDARDPVAVRRILESLPAWFGIPEAIDEYVVAAANETYASTLAVEAEEVAGVALVKRHFPESAELHLLAVAAEARGHGTGRALVDHVARSLAADGCEYLTVHTVGPSFEHEPYAETREFYRAVGFTPVEEHEGIDWDGPTLILVKPLHAPGGSKSKPQV